jgi:long-subunit fatty acid transport protein
VDVTGRSFGGICCNASKDRSSSSSNTAFLTSWTPVSGVEMPIDQAATAGAKFIAPHGQRIAVDDVSQFLVGRFVTDRSIEVRGADGV